MSYKNDNKVQQKGIINNLILDFYEYPTHPLLTIPPYPFSHCKYYFMLQLQVFNSFIFNLPTYAVEFLGCIFTNQDDI